MKTDELISALAADSRPAGPSPRLAQVLVVLAGGSVSLAILLAVFGVRPDFLPALATWQFDLKLALMALALALALLDCIHLASPVATGWASRGSIAIPALLAAAIAVELATVPPEAWSARLVGSNALVCLTVIPLLSIAPLALGMMAMRSAAPSSATAAGAAVGRLAAAVGAAIYALHCFDDSPLFVAVWYPLATLPVILLGALAGRRLLCW